MKTVTLHMNHTEAGVEHAAGQTVELPDESADMVASMVIQTRIAMRETEAPVAEAPAAEMIPVAESKAVDELN